MYTLTITGETIGEIVDKLNNHVYDFDQYIKAVVSGPEARPEKVIVTVGETKPNITPEQIEREEMKARVSIPITQTVEPTFTDLKNITLDLAKAKGRNASLEVLKQFGVEKITALKVDQYAEAFAAMKKALG